MIKIISNVMEDFFIDKSIEHKFINDLPSLISYLIEKIEIYDEKDNKIINNELSFYLKINENDAYKLYINKDNILPDYDKNNIEILLLLEELENNNLPNFIFNNFINNELCLASACSGFYDMNMSSSLYYDNDIKSIYNDKYDIKHIYHKKKHKRVKKAKINK
jgi:hypothetical protein